MADRIVQKGEAELVAVGRGMLRNPYWQMTLL
ncbi:2,4-dienoyl-CoA reductase-like NADH-dependent reductase (Old Yellow Enzyme family) [Bacillus capparidis]|uniref:2,4-dienoyl-CoA reductase-like NADH-dependent reductase (Old Yellow Enzyme family) n=1 Tax=Bacillus capparidis TaxID=1840411 RepID=A0ABS4CSY0_9BACI|nr:2,4-dienoyl-CoA reductase-like NADH-dependent reductase (Old Yellow Enzyme family) [Bacillus capparidis]